MLQDQTEQSLLQDLLGHTALITQPAMLIFVEPAASFADKGFAVPALTFSIKQEFERLQAMYTERFAMV